MNINDLTLGQVKQLMELFQSKTSASNIADDVIGKFCIARCCGAGVHAGYVKAVDGENVVLTNSVRLWSWSAKDGVALSGVAQNGIKQGCKIDSNNPVIYLTGVIELIPATKESEDSIYEKQKNS